MRARSAIVGVSPIFIIIIIIHFVIISATPHNCTIFVRVCQICEPASHASHGASHASHASNFCEYFFVDWYGRSSIISPTPTNISHPSFAINTTARHLESADDPGDLYKRQNLSPKVLSLFSVLPQRKVCVANRNIGQIC